MLLPSESNQTHLIERCKARCEALADQLQPLSLAVLRASPEVIRNRDTHFPYRQDSSFHYLSGFEEPESILILVKDKAGELTRHLLCRPKHAERELWEGFRWGPEAAKEYFEFDGTASIEELDEYLKPLLDTTYHIYLDLNGLPLESTYQKLIARLRRLGKSLQIHDLVPYVELLRLRKDSYEINMMKQAAKISAEAHTNAMRFTRPGHFEYEVEAVLQQTFLKYGSRAVAYPSIVAGGKNACVLHYRDNTKRLEEGELLLIDAGCEYNYYASDITRTFPVNGRFSATQRDLYTLVLEAQVSAIHSLRPGLSWEDYQQITLKKVAEGLQQLKLCQGSLDSIIESGDYKRFYMHRAGHWLGLDVHDAGPYLSPDSEVPASIILEEGMVLTVEPGCYVRPAEDVPELFWNTGIRIEDDVLITAQGCEVLTKDVPKTVEAIEQLMR